MVMKWIGLAAALAVGLGLLIYVIGALLPREHVAEARRVVKGEAGMVFERICDFAARPQWRKGLTTVAVENDRFFVEEAGGWKIRYEVLDLVRQPHRLVTRIADDSLEFGGRWIVEVKAAPPGAPSGSEVTIREEGFVKSPVFRFFSRFVFGQTRTMTEFLNDLERVQQQGANQN
jgi:Polyketide cyclase / dehydrase and lipid transport